MANLILPLPLAETRTFAQLLDFHSEIWSVTVSLEIWDVLHCFLAQLKKNDILCSFPPEQHNFFMSFDNSNKRKMVLDT